MPNSGSFAESDQELRMDLSPFWMAQPKQKRAVQDPLGRKSGGGKLPWDYDNRLGDLTLRGKVTLAASFVFFLAPLQNSRGISEFWVLFELEEGTTREWLQLRMSL